MEQKHVGQDKAKSLAWVVGTYWKHYKGGLYDVLALTVLEEDGDVLVSYWSEEGRARGWLPWSRRWSVFTGLVNVEDASGVIQTVARFSQIV